MARSAAGPPSTSAADAKAAENEAAGGGARARTPARSAVASAADAAHSRGYALRKQGNFLGAVEAYSEAIKLQPGHFKALFNRAFSYDKVLAWLLLILCRVHASSSRTLLAKYKRQMAHSWANGQWRRRTMARRCAWRQRAALRSTIAGMLATPAWNSACH